MTAAGRLPPPCRAEAEAGRVEGGVLRLAAGSLAKCKPEEQHRAKDVRAKAYRYIA